MSFKDPTARLARWAIYLQEYEFEIIHRNFSAHINVDTLSRPVLMVTTRSGNRNSIPVKAITENLDKQLQVPQMDADSYISPKSLDVYEDECLLYYLRNKKHMAGLSNKQIKRINKESKRYVYGTNDMDDEVILFRKNDKVPFLKVPKPADRAEIVEKAHLLGHFQVESTIKRIKRKYYWKGMQSMVEKFISL